ncbi:MAG TPA: IS200/IS605 family element transposase accessory protein TnpB [Synechococcus sp. M44_DOE_062]|nr:IS200/IS605 family element transposase accessory protein TnpB [Synechococcus sp. M44_DOE_062]
MQQTLTLVCRLQPTPEQIAKIQATLQAFAAACHYTNQTVKPNICNPVAIQAQVYQAIRKEFGLSANLAVRVCARVGANRKTAKAQGHPVKTFKPTSADYDARLFSYREQDETVSLCLVGGRERIQLCLGNHQRGKLRGQKPTSAQLGRHRDGWYYIHIQLTGQVPEPKQAVQVKGLRLAGAIGVDLGRREIAKTSTDREWDGQQLNQTRDRSSRVRRSLQTKASKGTRSTRRRARQILQRLSGRERRFQTWLNHTISASIVWEAQQKQAILALEDLTGIRERINRQPRSKTERRRGNSWAFYQLRQFLEYKALRAGVLIVLVPPAYTSQTCHKCLHIHPDPAQSYRSGKQFKCGHCGWEGDADLNGANVIAIRAAARSAKLGAAFVNQPRG